jgi:hypothetical protein
VCNDVLTAVLSCGDVEAAWAFASSRWALVAGGEGVGAAVCGDDGCRQLILALGRAGDFERAEAVVTNSAECGRILNVQAYTALVEVRVTESVGR